jgi:hypothetical protein
LRDGHLYRLIRDVPNAKGRIDRRAKYDPSKLAVFEAGSILRFVAHAPDENLRAMSAVLQMWPGPHAVVSWYAKADQSELLPQRDEADNRADVLAALVDALEEVAPDVDTVWSEEGADGYPRTSRAILQRLVDSGKVTLEDVRDALRAYLNETSEVKP